MSLHQSITRGVYQAHTISILFLLTRGRKPGGLETVDEIGHISSDYAHNEEHMASP